MDLASSQAFFWLAFGVSIFGVAAFICWTLFEVARLLRQSNEIVEHTREIAAEVEEGIVNAKEKFGQTFGTMVGLAKGVSSVAGFAAKHTAARADRKTKKTKKRFNKLLNEEEEE